jgi:hypothetical protein
MDERRMEERKSERKKERTKKNYILGTVRMK